VADALPLVDEPAEDGSTMRDVWAVDDAAAIWMSGRTLLEATGLRSHTQLRRPFERLAQSRVSLGLADDHTHVLWQGWEGFAIDRQYPREVGVVSGLCLAYALIHERWPVLVDVSALARFRCRYSGILYLRALAWLAGAGTSKRWERSPPGPRVTITVPVQDLHRALGHGNLRMVGEWNTQAFGAGGRGGPVHEDLARAGIRLKTEWIAAAAGYGTRQTPVALRITVAKIERAARVPSRPRLKLKRPQASSSSSMSPA
jgi:hypothetical protein